MRRFVDVAIRVVEIILDLSVLLACLGLMLCMLVMGLWPAPLKMQPGYPSIHQWLVRVIALAGAGVMILLLWLQVWLVMLRRKRAAGNAADPKAGGK